MKLPGAEQAFVDLAKLRDYALDPIHPEGKHKARVFSAALGLTRNDAPWLREQILIAARTGECAVGRKTGHGQRYSVDFEAGANGRTARLRSAWIIRPGENFPRLTSCYVL
jgi:hypothetical protein